MDAHAQKLSVEFKDATQKLKDSQADLGNEKNEISRLKAQVTAWFWGCAEAAVSHNWQLEDKNALEKKRQEEVCAHDHSISHWWRLPQISRLTLLASASTEKENKLFDENKAANVRVQIANEELAKLRVNFEHSKSEYQALQAERDKLVQENSRIANSEDSLEQKVRSLSKDIERLEV